MSSNDNKDVTNIIPFKKKKVLSNQDLVANVYLKDGGIVLEMAKQTNLLHPLVAARLAFLLLSGVKAIIDNTTKGK